MNNQKKIIIIILLLIIIGFLMWCFLYPIIFQPIDFPNNFYTKEKLPYEKIFPVVYQLYNEHVKYLCNYSYLLLIGSLFLMTANKKSHFGLDLLFLIFSLAVIITAAATIILAMDHIIALSANVLAKAGTNYPITKYHSSALWWFGICVCCSFMNVFIFCIKKYFYGENTMQGGEL
jgi:hypothetical protein